MSTLGRARRIDARVAVMPGCRKSLSQPRPSVTAHRPGLEGVQGEEGVNEPHFGKTGRKIVLPLSIAVFVCESAAGGHAVGARPIFASRIGG